MEILGLLDVPLWLLLVILTSLLLYVYGTWTHSVWSSQGVPGPKPWPLFGNTREINNKSLFHAYTEYQQEYGRVFGIYFGVRPALVVTDLAMIKEILVKNFANFSDRNLVRGMKPRMVDRALFFAGGSVWKRIRNMMTPTFSTSKLKLMSHYINRCSQLLSTSVEQKSQKQQEIDVKDAFGSFTMDVIAGTAFGLETNSQTEEGEPFVMHCKALFQGLAKRSWLSAAMFHVLNAFPFLVTILDKMGVKINFFNNEHAQFFIQAVNQMVEDRKDAVAMEQKRTDMLQMLVDAEADPEFVTDVKDSSDDTKSHRRMTKEEVVGQGFIVLLAGYETTATTLQYLTFNLVHNPDIQEKIHQEINNNVGQEDPTYENVSALKYLDAAIRETLRLFPPVAAIDRRAQEAVSVNGISLPADCGVVVPIYCIMHDPHLFHDPEKFIPERYLDENRGTLDPMLFELAFGYGPRQCIGMRLALLELKFAAVRIFRKFRFVKCENTPEHISLGTAVNTALPDAPIKVKAQLRDP